MFPVVIPDNMKSIVIAAENTAPRINDTFMEYAQSRGFVIDAARVATPTDKPRVERVVHYVQHNFFAGESFIDLADCRVRAETWCSDTAGMRIHGTTQCRPIEAFRTEELPLLLPRPGAPFDTPTWSDPKVHRDFHVEVDKAIYSVPHHLVGRTLRARLDSTHAQAVLERRAGQGPSPQTSRWQSPPTPPTCPRARRSTPPGTSTGSARMAADHGPAIGLYAAAILDTPLPWTKMRQVYRLLGLVKKWGPERVEQACRRALDAEAVDVNLVSRMLERAREDAEPERCAPTGRDPGSLRPRSLRVRQRQRDRADERAAPHASRPSSRSSCARCKLGQLLTTLPERLALARSHELTHVEFLEQLFSDEVHPPRRRLGRTAGPGGQAGPPHGARGLGRRAPRSPMTGPSGPSWSPCASSSQARNAFILGPVGVGKTFMATALGHIACRRRISVHFERHDNLHKRLKAARLDASYDARDAQAHRRRPARDRRLRPPALDCSRRPTSTSSSSSDTSRGHRADLEP